MEAECPARVARRSAEPKRRVRFADSVGSELVSIFLIDLLSNYYLASYNHHHLKKSHDNSTKNSNNNNDYLSNNNRSINNFSSSSSIDLNNANKQIITSTSTTTSATSSKQLNRYICEFIQPISLISFRERVRINKVHLETCQVNSTASHVLVACTIRVLNESFEKSVIVRYTTDDWHTHTDSLASYKPGSCDGWSDKFTSTFSVTNQVRSFECGQRIIFAIKYSFGGDNVYWDNNGGLNYSIKKV